MPDEKKTDAENADAENKANADEIEDVDATQDGARGNTHSEPGPPAQHEAPPPFPN